MPGIRNPHRFGPKGPKDIRKTLPQPRNIPVSPVRKTVQRRTIGYKGPQDAQRYIEKQLLREKVKTRVIAEAKGPLKVTEIHEEIRSIVHDLPTLIKEGMPILTAQKLILDRIAEKASEFEEITTQEAYIRAAKTELNKILQSKEYKKAVEERKRKFLEEKKKKLAAKKDHKYEISMHH